MAGSGKADIITKPEFDSALASYPELIKAISDAKSAKAGGGKLDLLQLDALRFDVLPAKYRELRKKSEAAVPLNREDVLRLVEWKLKHGTFRPALMSKCESNTKEEMQEVTEAAFSIFDASDGAVKESVKQLTTLRGIGPATASLLLSIHDPENVVFFSDEAFHWLCRGGERTPIKYNAKEYEELFEKSKVLLKRLNVGALDVERVAFVLQRDISASAHILDKRSTQENLDASKTSPNKNPAGETSRGKRKATSREVDDASISHTRPKRTKK